MDNKSGIKKIREKDGPLSAECKHLLKEITNELDELVHITNFGLKAMYVLMAIITIIGVALLGTAISAVIFLRL